MKLLKMGNFLFPTMFSIQSVSLNPLKATFQLSSATSLNLGLSQNSVLRNGLALKAAKICHFRTGEPYNPKTEMETCPS